MRNVNRGIMPGLQFYPIIWVCFSSLIAGDGLILLADVLQGTWCFHVVTFGGELWILEHCRFIGVFFLLFFSLFLKQGLLKLKLTIYDGEWGMEV